MSKLAVYVSDGCWSCEESVRIADEVRDQFPDMVVDVIKVADAIEAESDPLPDDVFAVPTWLLDGRVISLGTPTREILWNRLSNNGI